MNNSPELNFLAWIQTQPGLIEDVLPILPKELFSTTGREVVDSIVRGLGATQNNSNGSAHDPVKGRAFLRQQLLALIAMECGRASKNGTIEHVRYAMELLDTCEHSLTPIPLEFYATTVPAVREVIPTGIDILDNQIRGLARGELGIIAMPPGKGKSAMLIRISTAAIFAGYRVLYISVADQGTNELLPRFDACILDEAIAADASAETLMQHHKRAAAQIQGQLWIADYTDRECSLSDIERTIRQCDSDIVCVDHADDVLSAISADPLVTRHSLRLIYMTLKKFSVQYQIPVWTASQTHDMTWMMPVAGIGDLAEAKVGKSSGAAIVTVFTGGRPHIEGIMWCTIAKARRMITERRLAINYDMATCRFW